MVAADYHRHDMDDRTWALPGPHLPGRRGQWGGAAEDDRRLADAALRVPGTGAPWRDLPPDYGGWKSKHRRFRRRRDKRVWERPFGELAGEPDPGWPVAGATHVKARHDGTGATGGSEGVGRTKGARHEDTPGRGCAWYASWIPCRAWYLGGSRVCCRADQGVRRRRAAAEARL